MSPVLALATLAACMGLVQGQDWQLVWEDDFTQLHPDNWQHEITAWGGGNNEFQVYTNDPRNSYVKDGTLFLKPTLTMDNVNPLTGKPFGEPWLRNGTLDLIRMYGYCTEAQNYGCFREGVYGLLPPVMSARIRTTKRFSYLFGKMEIVAKMPVGDWLWPAMWLLPEDWVYGGWPRSGEIDIVEIIGNRNLKDAGSGDYLGIQKMGSALHWGPAWDDNKYALTNDHRYNESKNYGDNFHTYSFLWDEKQMRIGVDGVDVLVVPRDEQLPSWNGFWQYGLDNGGWSTDENPWVDGSLLAPFDKDMHIILNVAVGGTNGFIPDNVVNADGARPKPYNNGDGDALDKFWADRNNWYTSWTAEGENNAMQVRSVKVWQLPSQVGGGTTTPVTGTCAPGANAGSTVTGTVWAVAILVASLAMEQYL